MSDIIQLCIKSSVIIVNLLKTEVNKTIQINVVFNCFHHNITTMVSYIIEMTNDIYCMSFSRASEV